MSCWLVSLPGRSVVVGVVVCGPDRGCGDDCCGCRCASSGETRAQQRRSILYHTDTPGHE